MSLHMSGMLSAFLWPYLANPPLKRLWAHRFLTLFVGTTLGAGTMRVWGYVDEWGHHIVLQRVRLSQIFKAAGVDVTRTPSQAPNCNAYTVLRRLTSNRR